MLNMNRVTLLGHAGRDPEILNLRKGARAAVFSLATTERWRDRETGPEEEAPLRERTEWHRVVAYGPAVDVIEQRVRKGCAVLVEGRLATREYKDSEETTRYVTEIVVAGPRGVVNVLAARSAQEAAEETAEAAGEAA